MRLKTLENRVEWLEDTLLALRQRFPAWYASPAGAPCGECGAMVSLQIGHRPGCSALEIECAIDAVERDREAAEKEKPEP